MFIESGKGESQGRINLPDAETVLVAIKNSSYIDQHTPRYREGRRHSACPLVVQEVNEKSERSEERAETPQATDSSLAARENSNVWRGTGVRSDAEACTLFKARALKVPVDLDTLATGLVHAFLHPHSDKISSGSQTPPSSFNASWSKDLERLRQFRSGKKKVSSLRLSLLELLIPSAHAETETLLSGEMIDHGSLDHNEQMSQWTTLASDIYGD